MLENVATIIICLPWQWKHSSTAGLWGSVKGDNQQIHIQFDHKCVQVLSE